MHPTKEMSLYSSKDRGLEDLGIRVMKEALQPFGKQP